MELCEICDWNDPFYHEDESNETKRIDNIMFLAMLNGKEVSQVSHL